MSGLATLDRGALAPAGPPQPDPAIRTPDQRLRVFVSSTLDELAVERRAVSRAISALRLTPVMFESGARPHPPQQVYRAYLAQSDIFIGLYWERYGQIIPGASISGLEDEFGLSRALPRLLYVKTPAPGREPGLTRLLARVRHEASVSYRTFGTPAELARLVRDDLAMLLSERFAPGGPTAAAARTSSPGRSGRRSLPAGTTALIGRDRDIDEVTGLVTRDGVRLVTLTGPGGIGKTRLAEAAGERLRDRFAGGTVFVPLAAVTEPGPVLAAIGRAAGADLSATGAPLDALADVLGDDPWLLILDNLEQVVEVARDLDELLARCPGVKILATSRTVLRLRAEREYPVPALPVPADPLAAGVEALASSPAVALFVDRAAAVRPGFALTAGNAAAVAEICRRLEGLPLAIELAAARIRLLDPDALLARLARSLDALGTGAVDLPERQRTLRATVEWSVGLLGDAERSLLETVAVFADGWTIEAAAQVAGLDEDRALELSEALVRHCLIYLDRTRPGSRFRMLDTVREFVAERLAARPDAAEVGRGHAGYYRALAERADRPLRGAGQNEWADRLQAEEGNLAAAVRWYLARDRGPLPHLFRVLAQFWFLRDHMAEGLSWVQQLLPAAGALDPEDRAELLATAAGVAVVVGDDAATLAARERLAPILDGIRDPFLRALAQLALAWTSAHLGDLDGALREASAGLEQLRGQDEPFWTALAVLTLGSGETTLGQHGDALRHLTEVRDLGRRSGNAWLTATSQLYLGALATARGQLGEARALLDQGLALSEATHSTHNVALGLTAFAGLALAEGQAGRAALLAGAAEGLRRRYSLRAPIMRRRLEAELTARIGQALGTDRFGELFAAGVRLNRRQALAAVRGPGGGADS